MKFRADLITECLKGPITVYWITFSGYETMVFIDPYYNLLLCLDVKAPNWTNQAATDLANGKIPDWLNLIEIDGENDYNDDYNEWQRIHYPEFKFFIGPEYAPSSSSNYYNTSVIIDAIVEHSLKLWQTEHNPVTFVDQSQDYILPNEFEVEDIPLKVIDKRPAMAFVWNSAGKIVASKVSAKVGRPVHDNATGEMFQQYDEFPIHDGELIIYQDVKVAKIESVMYIVKLDFRRDDLIVQAADLEIIALFEQWLLENKSGEEPKSQDTRSEQEWPLGGDTQYMFTSGIIRHLML